MFARFKNLFSKTKNETEADVNADSETFSCASLEESVYANSQSNSNVNVEPTKLEGLNFLKSIVENEQNVVKTQTETPTSSLSEEVAELLKKRLSKDEEISTFNGFKEITDSDNKNAQENLDSTFGTQQEISSNETLLDSKENPQPENISEENKQQQETDHNEKSVSKLKENIENTTEAVESSKPNDILETSELTASNEDSKNNYNKDEEEGVILALSNTESDSEKHRDSQNVPKSSVQNEINPDMLQANEIADNKTNFTPQETDNTTLNSHEDSPDCSDSSKTLSQSSIKENLMKTALQTSSSPSTLETNVSPINSSIVIEDIPSEINTPSPTVDSTISSSSSSNTSTLDSSATIHEIVDQSKIIVNPIDNNGLACSAITNKLTDIAEVAESLDAVIREVQENVQPVELESNPSPSDKKLGTLRSTSSEDWHSRSTEDDSFATASEGNFTPHSHSSASFQTASGRTSSYRSCDKNSFDASEADDSTYAFEMPELTSPLNMSFEGSEQSYLSAQPSNGEHSHEDKEKTPTKLSESSNQTVHPLEEDQSSIADIEDLHSESVTPTPAETIEEYYGESIPIESETELEIAGIADAPSMEILTEHAAMPMSRTPEVSPTSSMACTNRNTNLQMTSNEVRGDLNDDQQLENTNSTNNNNNNKPNAAWRRSKYYENITKQTIKGFL